MGDRRPAAFDAITTDERPRLFFSLAGLGIPVAVNHFG